MTAAARLAPWLIAVALLLPLMFASPKAPGHNHLGLPRVFSGDEPHYLVMINSLLSDGDLDLANNYAAARAGAQQAGLRFAGAPLDHHTVWYENSRRREWAQVYQTGWQRWHRDAAGHLMLTLRPGQTPPAAGHPEYSTHPPGIALLLAPILFPFRGTTYVEPLAILCSTFAVIAAMLLFRALARKYSTDLHVVNLVTVVTFLGTPAWNYARTLFNEPYLLLFAVGAYSLALRGKSPLLAGLLIGLGMLMKPPFALFVIPLGLMYLMARDLRSVALLALPAIAALAAIFYLNDIMFGAPLRTSQEWLPGSFVTGATGVLFSLQYGYLFTAPAIVVALATWPAFFRAHRRDAIVLGSAIALYFALFASYGNWAGAVCYAARYEIPLLPLLFVALVKLPDTWLWRPRLARSVTVAICAVSIGLNAFAAMPYWRSWDTNYPMLVMHYKPSPWWSHLRGWVAGS